MEGGREDGERARAVARRKTSFATWAEQPHGPAPFPYLRMASHWATVGGCGAQLCEWGEQLGWHAGQGRSRAAFIHPFSRCLWGSHSGAGEGSEKTWVWETRSPSLLRRDAKVVRWGGDPWPRPGPTSSPACPSGLSFPSEGWP